MSKEYDLIVLGAGNAGFAPAGMAKEAGQSVLVVESRDFGGTCAIRGCVPKKVLVAAGETLDHIAKASDHKIDAQFNSIDWLDYIGAGLKMTLHILLTAMNVVLINAARG